MSSDINTTTNGYSGPVPEEGTGVDMTSMDHLPVPRPPKSKKKEIFNVKNYEYIDNHVKQVSPALLLRSIKMLVSFLTQPAQNDVGRVRALFLWLASVDMTSLTRPTNGIPAVDSPISSLVRIKEHKSNHAHLFLTLCREAKVPCIKVSGIGKNSRYQIGGELDESRMRSQWNAVVLDGQWRLIDVLWSSTSVVKKKAKDWSVQETGKEGQRGAPPPEENDDNESEQESMVHKVNEFFFLTDPEAFIYSHFPEDSKYQFLAKKINQKDFEMLPYLRERFFDMGVFLSEDSHPKCVLETVDHEVYIQFGLDPARSEAAQFRFLLHRGKNPKAKNTVDDVTDNVVDTIKGTLEQAVSLTKYPEELRLNLHLPSVSRYKLDIYGKEKENPECSSFDILCSYIIDFQRASLAYLEVHFLFKLPSDHARFLRRGGASDWLKRKDAALKVSGNEIIISFAMPTGPSNAKRFLLNFENRHQLAPPVIRSLLQILPPQFELEQAHDVQSGQKQWNIGKINILFLSHVNGLARTANGKVDIKLNLNLDTEIWYEFHEDHHTKGVPKDAVQLVSKKDAERTLLTFVITVEKPMSYILNVFTRNRMALNRFYHVKTYCIEYQLLDFV